MRFRFPIHCLALVLLTAGPASISLAQESNAPAQNPPAERRLMSPGGPNRPLDLMGPVLNVLTEEQRTSMNQAMQAQRESLRELMIKLRAARQELLMAGLDGKFDENAVRKQALVVANLEAELSVLRVKALSQIQPPLSPEQIEKIKNTTPAGPGPGGPPMDRPNRRRSLSETNRDENDLPPKQ